MNKILKDLYDCFYTPPELSVERQEVENLIPLNPALECKLPTARRKEMKVLTREEMQRLLIQAKYEGYYEVFLLELATGLRQGELMALQ